MGHSLFAMLILSTTIVSFGLKVNVVHKWKYCEYEWESEQQKEDAINSCTYDPYMCVLIDADKAEDGRVFVTARRELGLGAPATVATVTHKTGPGGPLLRPYPDWSWHNSSCTCNGIVNVYRVHIQCNHIVILDNGKIGSDQICNPKLLIFNLKNDTLVKTIYIPLDIATNRTGAGHLATPFVYYPETCKRFLDEMIVFITDILGSGLIVYDSSKKSICRIESDFMKSADVIFSVAGQNFIYTGGILSLTVLGDDLYYASLSGNEIYKIKIKTLLKCPNKEEANKNSKLVKRIANPILPMAAAEHVVFYSNVQNMSILGTNIYKKSDGNTVVLAQDSKKLQFLSGLKYSSYWDQLTYFSNRYQRFVLGTVNLNEIHFRYMEMDLADIREKTDLFSKTKSESLFSIF
ncbi:major royal jelly protein 3 [Mycetomoellerius zeteki]|uniref:major royal jelly protein 3 n=1 Tax=Mycetomoellerius zeteki TaxID=64791 RepID=UPI00084E3B35|nr:PREDICTED: major royal jelly protein 3-like [Trachymyrmex zeteki]